jgi:lipopolysaccharide transport system ATP-binding protein
MSSDVAIRLTGITKDFAIYAKPEHRLVELMSFGRLSRHRSFRALNDVSLEVRRGETVGIVGRNGCGKSTLLQIVCGILQPTSGTVETHGRIAALLELGAGFNGEFSGRENVFLNGAILGLTRAEMEKRFDAIAAFADIGDFIERPVKTYSSGMFVRLAFAVATAVEPEILVVDEALAVGDEAFQRKCFARIEAIKERGGTILFVSHAAPMIIQLCDQAILLDGGEKILEGRPKRVVAQYHRLINSSAEAAPKIRASIVAMAATGPALMREAVNKPDASEGKAATADNAGDAVPKELAGKDSLTSAEISGSAKYQETNSRIPADYLDPTLVTQSKVLLEERGARIRDMRVITMNGDPVNVLRMGKRYSICFDVDVFEAFEEIDFGATIRLPNGLAAAGCMTNKVRGYSMRDLGPNAVLHVQVHTTVNLLPGKYFVSAAIFGRRSGEEFIAHRVVDGLMIAVTMEFDLIATGIADAGMVVTVETGKAIEEPVSGVRGAV